MHIQTRNNIKIFARFPILLYNPNTNKKSTAGKTGNMFFPQDVLVPSKNMMLNKNDETIKIPVINRYVLKYNDLTGLSSGLNTVLVSP